MNAVEPVAGGGRNLRNGAQVTGGAHPSSHSDGSVRNANGTSAGLFWVRNRKEMYVYSGGVSASNCKWLSESNRSWCTSMPRRIVQRVDVGEATGAIRAKPTVTRSTIPSHYMHECVGYGRWVLLAGTSVHGPPLRQLRIFFAAAVLAAPGARVATIVDWYQGRSPTRLQLVALCAPK